MDWLNLAMRLTGTTCTDYAASACAESAKSAERAVAGAFGTFGTIGTGPDDEHAAFEERAAISEYDGGLSRPCAEVLSAMCTMPRPAGVTEAHIATVIDATARFLERRRPGSDRRRG